MELRQTEMNKIVIDAFKFRIREQNASLMLRRQIMSGVVCGDVSNIVDRYSDDGGVLISDVVADKCMSGYSAVYADHALSVRISTFCFGDIIFNYSRTCTPMNDDYSLDLCDIFEWHDYIEFILTGFNTRIFDSMFKIIRNADYGEFEMYIPCCHNGDAQTLTARLLSELRSEILNVE